MASLQSNRSRRRGAIRGGLLTGISTVAVSGSAAVAGALLSRHFGHGVKTDGFFAAYALYVTVVLVASALRVVVLPQFARAQAAGRLASEVGSWGLSLALPIVPVLVVALAEPHWLADALATGTASRHSATELVPWLIIGAVGQLFAGLCASALAALDDYGTAAVGYGAGAIVGLAVIIGLLGHGVPAFGWGLAANGLIAMAVPLVMLAARGAIGRPRGELARHFRLLGRGVALPLALQGLFLIAYRFADALGIGRPTTFSYAYLIASLLVAVTATSLALVSSVPLAREALTPERATRHIVSASWISLVLVAGTTGFFALAGARVTRLVLGPKYGGATGSEMAHLVAYMAPWIVVSIALSVAFPLLFIRGAVRWLPVLAVGALALQVLDEWVGRSLLGLAGLAVGMAFTTAAVLGVLLAALGGLAVGTRGLLAAAAYCGGGALVCFGLPRAVVGPMPAAGVGVVLYLALVALWRPVALRDSWSYLRALS